MASSRNKTCISTLIVQPSSVHRQQVYVLRKLLRKLYLIICAVKTPGFTVNIRCCGHVAVFADDIYDDNHKFIEQAETALSLCNGSVWCDLVCEATQPAATLQKAPLVGLYTVASAAFMEAARRMTERQRQAADATDTDEDDGPANNAWTLIYRMVVLSSPDDHDTRDWVDCTWTTASATSK